MFNMVGYLGYLYSTISEKGGGCCWDRFYMVC